MTHVVWVVNGFDLGQTVVLYGSVARLDAILLVLGHLVDVPAHADCVRLEGTPVPRQALLGLSPHIDDDVEAGRASSSEGAGGVYLVFQGGQVGLMLQLLVLPGDS
jgi:hypothetical protein